MYKHHNFSKSQQDQVRQAYKDLSQHFQLYELKSTISFPPNLRPNIITIADTIKYYHAHHDYLDIDDLNKLKPFLKSLRYNDKLFRIDGKLMLFHSYKLISFIEKYFYALVLYEEGDFHKNTFATLRGDNSEYLKKYNKYKNDMLKPDNFLKGESLIKALISRLYFLHPKSMEMFMNLQTLIPQHQIKEFKNDTLEINIMKNLYKYYGSTNITSHNPILKSLGIVVASYLKFKLNMKHKDILHSLNLLFDDYFYEQSDEKYTSPISSINNHLFTNTYIKGRINMIPIFGNSKKPLENNQYIQKLDWLFETSQKELGITMKIPIKGDLHPLENPLTVFFSQTPMELLQQTP